MKVATVASAVAAALLLPLAWSGAAAAPADAPPDGVATLSGELSPAAAALAAAGRSDTPPIAEARGKAVEYSRHGAAAPVPSAALAPSLAAGVAKLADARPPSAAGVPLSAKARKRRAAKAAKAAARRAPSRVSREAVSRQVAAKAAALPIDADVEAKMHEVRSAMDRLSSTSVAAEKAKVAKAAKAAKAAKGGRGAKAAAAAADKAAAAANGERAALRTRLSALEAAVTKVHKERDELRMLHAYATEENRQLTIKLHEVQLALQSASRAAAANPALSRWLSAKELDLSAFVAGTAYEYYTRHTYGPLTAALISYGVLLGPLAASALFFLRHAKALSLSGTAADLLTAVQAMSVFDAAFAAGLVAAIFVARLGDPLLALRDIAPPLFVFLFLAVAAQTAATVGAVGVFLKRAGGVRGHARVAWATAVKLVVTADFFGRMGVPALLGKHYIAPVPIGVYLAYVVGSGASLWLVHRARTTALRAAP